MGILAQELGGMLKHIPLPSVLWDGLGRFHCSAPGANKPGGLVIETDLAPLSGFTAVGAAQHCG